MNGSFNAYLLEDKPRLRRARKHVTMHRKMMLEDDIKVIERTIIVCTRVQALEMFHFKEYWGFYLLRKSQVRLSVCSRHEGASFIVVKGLKDARRCSYLGELVK